MEHLHLNTITNFNTEMWIYVKKKKKDMASVLSPSEPHYLSLDYPILQRQKYTQHMPSLLSFSLVPFLSLLLPSWKTFHSGNPS